MVLYISAATSYEIYDRQFKSGLFYGSSPAQKFNSVLIEGLSKITSIISLASLLYRNISIPRIEECHNGVRYICIKNRKGKMRRINNIFSLLNEGKKIIKNDSITNIICDSISVSSAISAYFLGKLYKIPVTAIVTDIPNAMLPGKQNIAMRIDDFLLKRFDSYVFLTKQMNNVVNLSHKPFIVVEGVCDGKIQNNLKKVQSPKIILYSGALWKNNAGIEYFTEGFIKAKIKGYELHFYGQGEAVEWIKKMSSIYQNVKYMGILTNDEIKRKQVEATLLINPRPSKQDFTKYSFPSKTMEYMLSGTPVLMTKLPGVPDEYYEFVYTIKDESVDGVACILNEIINDPHFEDKGKNAQQFVLNNKNALVQSKKILSFITTLSK